MLKKVILSTALAAMCWTAESASVAAQGDLKAVVDSSMKAMGAAGVRTMAISGTGFSSAVGQAFTPQAAWWRKFSNRDYVRSIDFDAKGWRLHRVVGEGENPPLGGAGRINPSPAETQDLVIKLGGESINGPVRGQGIDARSAEFTNEVEFAMVPVGFFRMALDKNASVKSETVSGKKYTVVTFPLELEARNGAFKTTVSGWINDRGLLDRVATTIDNQVLGDIVWEATFSGWKDFGGVKMPTRIVQRQGEPRYSELNVTDVKVNVPVDLTLPPHKGEGEGEGGGGGARAASSPVEDLGDGAWLVLGGNAGVIVELADYLVAVEGPTSDARAEQIISQAKKLAPNKPIRYVLVSHAHYDHIGGLRAFVAEGATIVAHEGNRGFFERAFANPHTLAPDRLSKMKPQPPVKVEYVGDRKVFTDGMRSVEMHRVRGSTHNAYMMMMYLPKQKILIEADEFNVPGHEPKAPENLYEVNLLANIERLKLDVDRILPIHVPAGNRKVMLAELKKTAGRP